MSIVRDAHFILILYFSYKREGAKRAVLTKATAVVNMKLKPAQPHASDVKHIRDERKCFVTLKYKK